MNRKWFGIAALVASATLLLSVSSCGHSQQLVSIAVQPSTVVFGSPSTALTARLTALGTYIHPPETKDITTQVTWKTDIDVVSVTGTGLVSPSGNGSCGVADVSASLDKGTGHSGNIVIGFAKITVDNTAIPTCPQTPL